MAPGGNISLFTADGLFRYFKPNVQDAAHRQDREQMPGLLSTKKANSPVRF
jgi:hypothetical protein